MITAPPTHLTLHQHFVTLALIPPTATPAMQPLTPRLGFYFAVLQCFFALCWVVYVIYLPQLAARAGIPKSWILWILVVDQLVFTLVDWWMGARADRASRVFGRLSARIALLTLVSALAFAMLPLTTDGGPVTLLLLIGIWTITSSALRAPPLMLIGKYAGAHAKPWLNASWLFGTGVAGALAPYLASHLRNIDPVLPFLLASVAVALTAWAVGWAERHLSMEASPASPPPVKPLPLGLFLLTVLLASLGFQIHFSVNTVPQYLRFASPSELGQLMPVFWVGFNLALFPLSWALRRQGDYAVLVIGTVAGGLAILATTITPTLNLLIAAQLLAGAGWAAVMFAAFGLCQALGHTGREGYAAGGLFSMFAAAALIRTLLIATQWNQDPAVQEHLQHLPTVLWAMAAVVLIFAVRQHTRPGTA